MISCVGDQTSVHHHFYYIYYYFDMSTKLSIELQTKYIIHAIADTIPNLEATSHPVQSYFHRLIPHGQRWWRWRCRCCCCCCHCRWQAGCGWLRLAMAHPPIGRTVENRKLAWVVATQLLGLCKGLSGCSISFPWTYSRKSSSKLPWSLRGCAIAGSVPVGLFVPLLLLRILSIDLTWTSGEEELISALRRQTTSVHVLLTLWLLFLESHLHCAPPPGPNTGGTLKSHVFQADMS